MMLSQELIKSGDISLFLKAGDLFDKKTDKLKPADMEEKAWKNILALSEHRFGSDSSSSPKFFQLPDKFTGETAKEWMALYKATTPEAFKIPEEVGDAVTNSNIHDFL